ncbi:MAG: cytochrome c biogenesis protein ResB [Undibacterium sp.]|nr:cytochrome c biogenesis protein ResB [Opitutaceae bacterium]
MNEVTRQFRDFFVSLKLTIVLLALSIILIFAATVDQVNLGIWAVQQKYFHSLFVLWRVGDIPVPVFPGGYLIGGFLLINLISAQVYRFKLSAKKSGIWLTHVGLIILLIGELLTGLWQEEFALRLDEGQSKNYSESYRFNELAVTETTDAAFDDVVVIPEKILARGEAIQHAKLPFRIVPKLYYPNATIPENDSKAPTPSHATKGIGLQVGVVPLPLTYKQDERNLPAAYVELVGADGLIGTWLVYANPGMPPQRFEYAGRSWKIALRYERNYKPFSLTLLKFSNDRYAGTAIPKNYSSRIRLNTPEGRDDREVLIYMNNPLRYAGLTFYQASFDGPKTTILQVVRNPSWQMPYIACTLMTLGLLIQFGIHLVAFIARRRKIAAVAA